VSPYSSTRRSLTHCARRSLRNPRTGPDTRCDFGQKGQTNRVPCALGISSTITAQPDRHMRNKICGAGPSFDTDFVTGFTTGFAAGFATGFTARRRTVFRARVERLVARRDVLVAVIRVLSVTRRTGFIFCILKPIPPKNYGLRRSTIIRSLLRFLRVFAPSVGKPHGVCGWLPFTRPSPPPCG